MASPVYVTIKDEQGQQVKANVQIKGREGTAEGHAFDYTVSIPSDKNTGQLTAVRQHHNVILIKALDSASPVLFDACCRGKTLQSVRFDWYHINDRGEEEVYFTHTLSSVKVVAVKQFMLHVKDPHNDGYNHQEEVSMRFQKIDLNYPDGNIKASDDWLESRSSSSA
ncbi:MAG: type VI secretion system tube protein Hcp [Gammaproteobacteria bacterium]|nr:type VI secretion system tube protein Hcp [Gammaproteobacteria bacterium]